MHLNPKSRKFWRNLERGPQMQKFFDKNALITKIKKKISIEGGPCLGMAIIVGVQNSILQRNTSYLHR